MGRSCEDQHRQQLSFLYCAKNVIPFVLFEAFMVCVVYAGIFVDFENSTQQTSGVSSVPRFQTQSESSNERKATPRLTSSRNALVWPGTDNRRLAGFQASRSRL